jgi:predicted lactoylglutathione lyase
MIGYTTVGSNDLEKACTFYDQLLAELGAKRMMEMDNFVLWANNPDSAVFAVTRPFDGEAATVGNGIMIALLMDSKEKVESFQAKALALGGTDEGAPGFRGDTFYAAYFRDLDGNKLCAFHIVS